MNDLYQVIGITDQIIKKKKDEKVTQARIIKERLASF